MAANPEQRFVAAVDGLEFASRDLAPVLRRLDGWLAGLMRELEAGMLVCQGLEDTSVFARQANAINAGLRESMRAWADRLADLEPAQTLAEAFDDKVILLVFGKFNAGKSAFCNFLAGRLCAHGMPARHFRVEAGGILPMSGGFKEGSTETTAQLQGVILGDRLVLLDTPGLHSVTPENAALTRRFIDSADGVLWLTSSTSPGQVQELDEMAREALRGKPLLPVLTRSDVIEEDEVDGGIRKVLCNKTLEARRGQERDVDARAAEKLESMGADPRQLKPSLSISAHVARERGQTAEALREAGFDRLYAALLEICGPALAYKSRKPAEMLLHHFEENVLCGLWAETLPRLAELGAGLASEPALLEQRKVHGVTVMWRSVASALPGVLERHAASDARAIRDDVTLLVREAAGLAREALAGYAIVVGAPAARTGTGGSAGHEWLSIGDEVWTPGAAQDGVEGGETGAACIAGAGFERLHAALEAAVRQCLDDLMDDAMAQCRGIIDQLASGVETLRERLHAHAGSLREIGLELREQDAD